MAQMVGSPHHEKPQASMRSAAALSALRNDLRTARCQKYRDLESFGRKMPFEIFESEIHVEFKSTLFGYTVI